MTSSMGKILEVELAKDMIRIGSVLKVIPSFLQLQRDVMRIEASVQMYTEDRPSPSIN